jgi:RecJ-like exonuclease
MNTSRHRAKYELFIIIVMLLLFLNCNKIDGEWFDNGLNYLCPECRDKGFLTTIGTCQRCGGMTSSISFKYCYDCAKELNRCQCCGVER